VLERTTFDIQTSLTAVERVITKLSVVYLFEVADTAHLTIALKVDSCVWVLFLQMLIVILRSRW